MKRRSEGVKRLALAVGLVAAGAEGGVPLNGLQGNGGIAFNPLAYTSGTYTEDGGGWVSKPQLGLWYTSLRDADIDWAAASVSLSLLRRVELSYGYGLVSAPEYGDNGISSHNVGLKVRFLDENLGDNPWVPALAVGGLWKYTDSKTVDAFGLRDNGFDAYLVATKLITQTPLPVLLSAGVLFSDEVVNGVVGHNDYGVAFFGNVDILPVESVAIGVEYKQGIDAGGGIQNSDYWNGHVAWFVTDKLTLVGAYVDTGSRSKGFSDLGVGRGFVLSAQYAF